MVSPTASPTIAGTTFNNKGSNVQAQGGPFENCNFNIFPGENDRCLQDLCCTNPSYDKKRIEDSKGGLLEDSYRWIFENSDFQQWRDNSQSRLLWIKGDPGKGKTMLLCGIINELSKPATPTTRLCYFFCQATDSRINSATAVLRGLLYMLVLQQPSLVAHLRKKYDQTNKALFEDANAWVLLCDVFTVILQDPSLGSAYFFVDALDECVIDLEKLLVFIVQTSSRSSHVKWIVTSRGLASIEGRLGLDSSGVRLSLELKENAAQVSRAVDAYIDYRLREVETIQHDQSLQLLVRQKMQEKANGTFLWVSLVMEELKDAEVWEVLQVLEAVPKELTKVYQRMLEHIKQLKLQRPELCLQVLATIVAAYRPLHLQELYALADLFKQGPQIEAITTRIVKMCGSFLTLREDHVYVVHQSARDFLSDQAGSSVFSSGTGKVHTDILSRSLRSMFTTLQRDMYDLHELDYPAEQIQPLDPDPLVASRYSCVYWVDHLCDSETDLQDGGTVNRFLETKYLYWLEALSLCKSMSQGVLAMAKLETLVQRMVDTSNFKKLVQDANQFIMYHNQVIRRSPLQAYASALIFSPDSSLVKKYFGSEEQTGILIKPLIGNQWSTCFQTLSGHSKSVNSVAFSHDSLWLASGSSDMTVKIWNASSGECIKTLSGHDGTLSSVAFSHDSAWLASGSYDSTVKIWNASNGECIKTLSGHSNRVRSVAFSHDSAWLASGSSDRTVKIWDSSSGKCLQTLKVYGNSVNTVTFSHHSAWLASSSDDKIVKIWNPSSGECMKTLSGHFYWVNSIALSHDSAWLASSSEDKTVKIWDLSSGECVLTLSGHSGPAKAVAFSHDSAWLASGSSDRTVKIWNASSGECLQTLSGHGGIVKSLAVSHDSARLASSSDDKTVKIWNVRSGECVKTLNSHHNLVCLVAFSHDSAWLASGSSDRTVKIWDTSSGECIKTLSGHSNWVSSVAFSHSSTWLVSGSSDWTVKIWNASSGECLQTLSGHSNQVNSVAFSHDSLWLASGSSDMTVKIWNASNGECLQTLSGHSDLVRSVAFSHDSAWLASGSYDETVKIWNVSSGESLQTLSGHSRMVRSVDFSHDSAWLVSASSDKMVKLWDLSSGECLHTLKVEKSLCSVFFDSSDRYLRTDIGVIDISGLPITTPASISEESQIPWCQGLGLSVDGTWITHNSKKVLWVPSDYQPYCSAVSGDVIAIGATSGRVWICKIQSP